MKKENVHKKIIVNAAFTFTVLMIFFVTLTAIPIKENKTESSNESIKTFSISTTVPTEINETVTTEPTTTTLPETNTTAVSATKDETNESTEPTTETTTESLTKENITETTEETNEEQVNDEPQQEEQPIVSEPELPPEPQYVYNNGDFSASAYGYDGDVHITITIENDVIISISGYTDESDNWYFDSASGQVIPAILNSQNADVDAYSGATYSSNAIMQAVKKALDSARK